MFFNSFFRYFLYLTGTKFILAPKGRSPYQIITSHPELNISEKTLYNYIESGVFRQFGLLDIDLRVKTRISKKDSVKYKKEKTENS